MQYIIELLFFIILEANEGNISISVLVFKLSVTIIHSWYLFPFQARSWFLSLGYTLCLGSVLPRVLFAYKVVSWRPKTIKTVRMRVHPYTFGNYDRFTSVRSKTSLLFSSLLFSSLLFSSPLFSCLLSSPLLFSSLLFTSFPYLLFCSFLFFSCFQCSLFLPFLFLRFPPFPLLPCPCLLIFVPRFVSFDFFNVILIFSFSPFFLL